MFISNSNEHRRIVRKKKIIKRGCNNNRMIDREKDSDKKLEIKWHFFSSIRNKTFTAQ